MRIAYSLLTSCLLILLATAPTAAYENHEMWEKVRVGGKLCMKSHEHYGESPPWVSKRGAQAYARRAWEKFTTWEYGARWGKLRHATGKRASCKPAGQRWICSITARPCHR